MKEERARVHLGVLQSMKRGGGYLRNPDRSYQPEKTDVWVSHQLIKKYELVQGATLDGKVRRGKRGPQLVSIDSICGLTPEEFRHRTKFDRMQPIDPCERFRLGDGGNPSMRIVELFAPIGKGTRGLIVSPPKAGKTVLLEQIAKAILESEPDSRIIVILIDERPEEITHFRRSVDAEVLASSSDQSIESHVNLAELAMAHIRCELECGRDIVILVDSITRMGRAFNLHGSGSRRTMSGGLDAKALEIPRRFFGLARNIENGGSVTVIATALVDTGSRMDTLIFEEFKGTGNSEIVLDRSLSESRIFPAINLVSSGTRKEELLYNEDEIAWLSSLRRILADVEPEAAMKGMLKLLETGATNEELFKNTIPATVEASARNGKNIRRKSRV